MNDQSRRGDSTFRMYAECGIPSLDSLARERETVYQRVSLSRERPPPTRRVERRKDSTKSQASSVAPNQAGRRREKERSK
jgi:hypothetical protein